MDIGSLIDRLVGLVDEFDPASLVPQLNTVIGWVETFARLCVMAAPLLLLGLGLWYLFMPPKEANYSAGYRFYFGMGSIEAWRFTQRLAGMAWTVLGLILTVIMALICIGFRGMDAVDMASTALSCVLWELGLIAVCCIAINVTVALCYDKDGNRRDWNRR
ncbi:MAG: SdpI family protein [Oscillospiraceae bacterium]|nr:SdpI family protein [Oscillospiraceae bacterium]